MRKDRGRHEQKNYKGLADSRQQVLKILRLPLFQATLADRTSAARACQISQPYNNVGKQNDFIKRTATISSLLDPSTRMILLKAP